jgi:hypothetical protein
MAAAAIPCDCRGVIKGGAIVDCRHRDGMRSFYGSRVAVAQPTSLGSTVMSFWKGALLSPVCVELAQSSPAQASWSAACAAPCHARAGIPLVGLGR